MSATSEDIQNCIIRRVGKDEMQRLITLNGFDAVFDNLNDCGEIYSGCDEIGTSDVSAFVTGFLTYLKT